MKKLVSVFIALSMILVHLAGITITANASTAFDIIVNVIGNGTVSPNSVVSVINGETQSFTVTPGDGYSLEYIKFNKIIVASGLIGEQCYETPAITTNSTLEIKFYPESSELRVITSPFVFKGKKNELKDEIYTFSFGKVLGNTVDLTEMGMMIGSKKYFLEDAEFNKALTSKIFGIGLYDPLSILDDIYDVTPYVTSPTGDILGASTSVNKSIPETVIPPRSDATLKGVAPITGLFLNKQFSPYITSYEVYATSEPIWSGSLIGYEKSDNNAVVSVTEPTAGSKQMKIEVIAEDQKTTKTYVFDFIIKALDSGSTNVNSSKALRVANTQGETTPAQPVALPGSTLGITQVAEDNGFKVFYEFDLSTLPDSAILNTATIKLYAAAADSSNTGSSRDLTFYLAEDENLKDRYSAFPSVQSKPLNPSACKVLGTGFIEYTFELNAAMLQGKSSAVIGIAASYDPLRVNDAVSIYGIVHATRCIPNLTFTYWTLSSDSSLSEVTVDSEYTLSGSFNPAIYNYNIYTTAAPNYEKNIIGYTTSNANAKVVFTKATADTNKTIIEVTAEDQTSKSVYQFNYIVKAVEANPKNIVLSKSLRGTLTGTPTLQIGPFPTTLNQHVSIGNKFFGAFEFDLDNGATGLPQGAIIKDVSLGFTSYNNAVAGTNDREIKFYLANYDSFPETVSSFPTYGIKQLNKVACKTNGVARANYSAILDGSMLQGKNSVVIVAHPNFPDVASDTITFYLRTLAAGELFPTLTITYWMP